jgi:glycosyltransferase involved in cell wall biosynthesis
MHILINGWFVGQSAAGMGQYIDHLLAHLPQQEAGHQFTVLTPQEKGRGELASSPLPHLRFLSFPLPPLPRPLAKLWWEQFTVPLAGYRLQADLIFVPYWGAPLWQPRPTVVTIHDLIPVLLPDYQGGLLQRLYFALVSLSARGAASILTVSHASARDIVAHLKIPAERVFAVHHGPNWAGEAQEGREGEREKHYFESVRRKYGLPARYFLYLGGFDVRKNVEGILAAYGRYLEKGGDPAVKLVLAGRLPGADTAFTPDPQRMAADRGVLAQVHFTDWVDEHDKPALYALATAFLFPSRYEGFGMMVLEAMAAGCPVVTSKAP